MALLYALAAAARRKSRLSLPTELSVLVIVSGQGWRVKQKGSMPCAAVRNAGGAVQRGAPLEKGRQIPYPPLPAIHTRCRSRGQAHRVRRASGHEPGKGEPCARVQSMWRVCTMDAKCG